MAGVAVAADGLGDGVHGAKGGEGALGDDVALRGLAGDVEDAPDRLGGAALVEEDGAALGAEDDALRGLAAPAREADASLDGLNLGELGEEGVDEGVDVGVLAVEVGLRHVVREELRRGAGAALVVGEGGGASGEVVEAVDGLHHEMPEFRGEGDGAEARERVLCIGKAWSDCGF